MPESKNYPKQNESTLLVVVCFSRIFRVSNYTFQVGTNVFFVKGMAKVDYSKRHSHARELPDPN